MSIGPTAELIALREQAEAHGADMAAMRAENERVRAENERLRAYANNARMLLRELFRAPPVRPDIAAFLEIEP